MREAAMRGDGIAGAYFELESAARKAGFGLIEAIVDQDPEDWDDIRPY
jgi:hypothetical protein